MTRQKLGQHFLANPGWRNKIFDTLDVTPADTWVEIGAGHGEMTEPLARSAARVLAIETDASLAASLRTKTASWGNVEILEADVLRVDFARLPGGKFRVYGNLPYYITSPILRRLFDAAGRIASIHIVIQHEVAARIAARPARRDYGYLSVLCQFFATPKIIFKIPPGAFRPPPRVTSALVQMTLPGEGASLRVADPARFMDFVSRCFGQKRKTLWNNLRGLVPEEKFRAALRSCGLRSDSRAEQLSLTQFAALFRAISAD